MRDISILVAFDKKVKDLRKPVDDRRKSWRKRRRYIVRTSNEHLIIILPDKISGISP